MIANTFSEGQSADLAHRAYHFPATYETFTIETAGHPCELLWKNWVAIPVSSIGSYGWLLPVKKSVRHYLRAWRSLEKKKTLERIQNAIEMLENAVLVNKPA